MLLPRARWQVKSAANTRHHRWAGIYRRDTLQMMGRLFILWEQPAGGSDDETRDWLRQEVWNLQAVPGIEELELVRVGPASERHARWHDWLLVAELQRDIGGDVIDREPLLREFVEELRSLRAKPIVLLESGAEMAGPRRV
jgi:hypothetical protein